MVAGGRVTASWGRSNALHRRGKSRYWHPDAINTESHIQFTLPALGNAYRVGDLFYGEVLHLSGEYSARLLILTLAITPLRLFFADSGWPNWLMQRRRYFGVAAFAYGLLHTIVYLQRKGTIDLIVEEAADFSIWTGWIALLIFTSLAITSNDRSVRWLKSSWKSIHRWAYIAAVLTFVHWIFAAFDFLPGLYHLLVLLGLEAYRIWKQRQLRLSSAAT